MKTNPNDLLTDATKENRDGNTYKGGLTKREYFAAMAMQGLCSNSIPGPHHGFEVCAKEAVKHADALIEELNK